MRAKRIRFAAVVSFVLVLAAIAGSTAQARTESGSAQVTLTMWIMNNGPEPVADMKRILAPFERSGINVNVQLVGWDVQYQRITNAAISGEAPDVTQAGTTQVPYFAALGGFENLAKPRRLDRRPQGVRGRDLGDDAARRQARRVVRAVVHRGADDLLPQGRLQACGREPADRVQDVGVVPRGAAEAAERPRVNGKPIMPFGQPGKTAWTSCTTSCRSSGAPAAPS